MRDWIDAEADGRTCTQRVEEEEELAHGSTDVKRVEGLLQAVQLRQSGDQLQDVVLQILNTNRTITRAAVMRRGFTNTPRTYVAIR